jgi:hypothetical protein
MFLNLLFILNLFGLNLLSSAALNFLLCLPLASPSSELFLVFMVTKVLPLRAD